LDVDEPEVPYEELTPEAALIPEEEDL